MTEIEYNKPLVTIWGNQFDYEQTIILNESQVHLCVNNGQVYLLTADEVSINSIVQTSAQMIADTFNA